MKRRCVLLSELESVDYIFPIHATNNFITNKTDGVYDKVTERILPTHIITDSLVDIYWEEKKSRASKFGLKLLDIKLKKLDTSTRIIQKLESEL